MRSGEAGLTLQVFFAIVVMMLGAALTLQACDDCANGGVVLKDIWGVPRCVK